MALLERMEEPSASPTEPASQHEKPSYQSQKAMQYRNKQVDSSQPGELLYDSVRPSVKSGQCESHHFIIGEELVRNLQELSRDCGTTFDISLLAVSRATQYRLTGAEDVASGFTVSCQHEHTDVTPVDGLQYIQSTTYGESLYSLVRQLHNTVTKAYQNHKLVSARSSPKLLADTLKTPVVRMALFFHPLKSSGDTEGSSIPSSGHNRPYNDSELDLELHIHELEQGLRGRVVFSTDIYSPSTVSTLVSVFSALIVHGASDPYTPIVSIKLLKDSSELPEHLLNVQETDYPRNSSIVDVFRKQAAATPDSIAVKDSSSELTYRRLDYLSDHLAHWLSNKHFDAETLIGVLGTRSCETIVMFLGVLKANLAYLPLDVKNPRDRTRSILSSIQGRKMVLVGRAVQISSLDLGDNIEYTIVSDILRESELRQTNLNDSTIFISPPSATSLAYVIFTSGSTGKPKGVMAEHRGVVRLVKQTSAISEQHASQSVAHMSNIAFDVSTCEIYTALLNGGTLICIDSLTVLDVNAMESLFRAENIRIAYFTPALVTQYLTHNTDLFGELDVLITGGERCSVDDAFKLRTLMTGSIINALGPTENTVHSVLYKIPQDGQFPNGVPIGRAVDNSGAYVMDAHQRLVPVGVLGELVVTGDGLARGYTDPALNVNRFVKISIQGRMVRAYRTGDYVRYRPSDQQLEYFGRMDQQVKIRGYRIELGEIERSIMMHKFVSEAVVLANSRDEQETQIISYITVHENHDTIDEANDLDQTSVGSHVGEWNDLFTSKTYANVNAIQRDRYGRDFTGWTSMYDGKQINEVEMKEWLDDTIHTIVNSGPHRDVMEVGTGTGMILSNLPDLRSYVGLEPSPNAVAYVNQMIKTVPYLIEKVQMHIGTAADVATLGELNSPDVVVVNSVVQYFPTSQYLFDLIQNLFSKQHARTVFIGDVRSYALYKEFQVTKALHHLGGNVTPENLMREMANIQRAEEELLVDPSFFTALSTRLPDLISHVEIIPKVMAATNELSAYRFAAVIHGAVPDHELRSVDEKAWINFVARKLEREDLVSILQNSGSSVVQVENIPFSKVALERHIVNELDQHMEGAPTKDNWISSLAQVAERQVSLAPKELIDIAHAAGYEVEISCARQYSQGGGLDAIFHRLPCPSGHRRVQFRFPTENHLGRSRLLSTEPARQKIYQRVENRLRSLLATQLPSYMVPSVIRIVEQLPLNPNGKVDRQKLTKLAKITGSAQTTRHVTPPRNQIERIICEEFAAALGCDIGVQDSFFDFGGHSLMATRMVSRINKRWKASITVGDVFTFPLVEDLAKRINLSCDDYSPIPPSDQVGPVEQSFAQGRLWFLDRLHPGSAQYLVPIGIRLRGQVSYDALHLSLMALEKRHETLRAIFKHIDGVETQIVTPFGPKPLHVVPVSEGWTDFCHTLKYDQNTPFNIETEPGWRHVLYRLNDTEHVLSIVIHHIVFDGWSLGILQRELAAFYSTSLRGEDPSSAITSLPIQYRDFSTWQRQEERAGKYQQQLKYWTDALQGSQPAVFISDKRRPNTPLGKAGSERITIEGAIYDRLQQFCKQFQVTVFAVLLSVFRATHFRMTGVEDATLGTPTANRNRHELEDLIGFFVNLQGIRLKVDDISFAELVEQTHKTVAAAHSNQDVPFESIVAALQNGRADLSRNPLVQTIFAFFSERDAQKFEFDGLEAEQMPITTGARFDLELHIFQEEKRLQGSILFAEELYESSTIACISSTFHDILRHGLQAPGSKVHLLPLENGKVTSPSGGVVEWTGHPRNSSVVDVFQNQARLTPTATAVADSKQRLTYAELNMASNQLAHWLRQRAITSQSIVGVLAPRSCETITLFLGILKANLAYLPLDINSPASRIESILGSIEGHKLVFLGAGVSRPKLVLKDVELVHVPDLKGDSLLLDDKIHSIGPGPTSLAYVMFTSGSTGRPKGVMIEHRGILRLVQPGASCLEKVNIPVAHLTNIAFDVSTWEIYAPLLNGGTVICIDKMVVPDAAALGRVFIQEQVQAAILTPALLKQILADSPSSISALDTLIVAGDRFDSRDALKCLDLVPGKVYNGYGPTENTVLSSIYQVNSEGIADNGVPIGKSVPNSEIYVMDTEQRLMPPGVLGELVVTGDGLARGYVNPSDELDRFVTVIINGHCTRAYRTGDIGRIRPTDGQLEFFGRMDYQVKIRGHRIELPEIEQILLADDGVADAAVVLRETKSNDAGLVAFVKLTCSDSQHDWASLQKLVGAKLPAYMCPGAFAILRDMPINENGKIDRKALTKLAKDVGNQVPTDKYVPPQNDRDRMLCAEFQSLLGVEVGMSDDFFHLGGHSLMASTLAHRIRKRFDCNVQILDIMRHPTPAELSMILKKQSETSRVLPAPWYLQYHTRPNNTATLILIHGLWGQGSVFSPMIPLLNDTLDVLVVHDPFFGVSDGPQTIAERAKLYLDDIKKQIPRHHTVLVGGYSFGGLIAFEMALSWKNQDRERPVSLVLLDPGRYSSQQPSLEDPASQQEIQYAMGVFGEEQKDLITAHYAKSMPATADAGAASMFTGHCLYIVTDDSIVSGIADWWEIHCPALRRETIHCTHHGLLDPQMIPRVCELIMKHSKQILVV